ncbi:DNA-binding transcriptional regulator, MerR family [Arcanobacterium phocae]|uniref:DNA-binding transcriptional regulator, MerR family n=1 Tax=Arcanobacterium phocae TaxID=131112 RepID=A0A1H2LG46_9ACTO|nr:MerR family transcriptional regulator [Arcanobacterium phocae]SDU79598.1 DNA-binding transcriptional regulator, MerR family [Arcanobacterium phocae]
MILYSQQLTKLTGASRKALRLYEDRGLLTAIGRDTNGWRIYTAEHLLRVATIKFLQESGLTLDDIAAVLADSQTSQPWDLAEQRLKARIAEAQEKLAVLQQLKNMRTHDADLPLYSPDISDMLNTLIEQGYPAEMAYRSGRILQFLEITLAPEQWQAILRLGRKEVTNIDDEIITLAREFVDLANVPASSPQIDQWRDKALSYTRAHPETVHTGFNSLGIEQNISTVLDNLWVNGLSPAQLRASAIFD